MGYSTYDDVVALTGTSLTQAEVEKLIEVADEEINSVLSREGISINTSSPPTQIYLASLYLSSALVLERQRTDITMPDSMRLGDLSVSLELEKHIQSYRKMAKETLAQYISLMKRSPTIVVIPGEEDE